MFQERKESSVNPEAFPGEDGTGLDDWIESELLDRMSSDPHGLLSAQEELRAAIAGEAMSFEGRPYPVSIRPLGVTSDQAAHVRRACEGLVAALDTVAALYRDDARAHALFPAYDAVRDVAVAFPGFSPLVRACRIDGVIDDDGRFRVLEMNTACPGGVIQSGMATRLWHQIPGRIGAAYTSDLSDQVIVTRQDSFVSSLFDSHAQLRQRRPEQAAVVNYRGCYMNEVDRIVDGLQGIGVKAGLLDAGALRWDGRHLRGPDNSKLDLVYNKLDPLDLITKPELRGYLAAAAADAVTFINPLIAQWVLEDKASLAVLTDQRFESFFTVEQRRLIAAHVPWTRFCGTTYTTAPDGSPCELAKLGVTCREDLVLKPTNSTRGEGVVIGRHVSQARWETELAAALGSATYVMQEYASPRQLRTLHPETMRVELMTAGLDAYMFGGRLAGLHSRASLDPVLNMKRGGVLLPVLVSSGGMA
jgi:hypothetical protein